jgi:hypothetical protein
VRRGGDGGEHEGDDPPASLAQEDRDREGGGGMVAGEAGVSGVAGEEVNAMRVGDEGTRPVAFSSA